MAILFAVEKWRSYLIDSHFKIITDHQTLRHLHDQHITTPAQHKWLAKLLGYNYTFEYRAGSLNKAADALSRQSEYVSLLAISAPSFDSIIDIQALYTSDPDTISILNAISTNTKVPADLSFQNQLLLYQNRIFVLRTSPWCLKILTEFHSSPVAGHFEFLCTYKPIRSPGLLQPLPIPHGVWHDISLDFVKGFPKSVGKNALLVVVDQLTKYGHFVPLTHPFIAAKISDIFIKEIFDSMACQKLLSMVMIPCSFPISETLSSRLKECNYAIAPSIIHRVMVRLKFLIAR
ncbi:hypothetical protein L3X38_030062 [Prunus dulcis]|uniref:Reverse transcriptase RNase H-like domain-containing protein n=1 Tax=Prunus dulcis TaxID=3755 RepID=A0AAD4VUB0_PRUDU|nr:hypothetical protein L3X38_030062 [Prunus dulcis]